MASDDGAGPLLDGNHEYILVRNGLAIVRRSARAAVTKRPAIYPHHHGLLGLPSLRLSPDVQGEAVLAVLIINLSKGLQYLHPYLRKLSERNVRVCDRGVEVRWARKTLAQRGYH
jgi:hypothetical protein